MNPPLLALFIVLPLTLAGEVLFKESFEDSQLTNRGWYDNTNRSYSTKEHISGSQRSMEIHFDFQARLPTSGLGMRRLFTPTDSIYVSYYVKYSKNWEGSNRPYHPHEFSILTTEDDKWVGPAYTHLTLYIEQNEGVPLLAIQDAANIDESRIRRGPDQGQRETCRGGLQRGRRRPWA